MFAVIHFILFTSIVISFITHYKKLWGKQGNKLLNLVKIITTKNSLICTQSHHARAGRVRVSRATNITGPVECVQIVTYVWWNIFLCALRTLVAQNHAAIIPGVL